MKFPVAVTIAAVALSSVALASETYKFDQARSTIGFSVHQFLGTTHANSPNSKARSTSTANIRKIHRSQRGSMSIASTPEL